MARYEVQSQIDNVDDTQNHFQLYNNSFERKNSMIQGPNFLIDGLANGGTTIFQPKYIFEIKQTEIKSYRCKEPSLQSAQSNEIDLSDPSLPKLVKKQKRKKKKVKKMLQTPQDPNNPNLTPLQTKRKRNNCIIENKDKILI
ncbi:UNKNOWN [Stylonychia lemnae]|uniref:Uncharacterized protein n=1 Tax=Stylonychia lemnae TaxID=5949 RepID=A0A078AF71_STYLE|nr:UNKNOWN [Stylonychia lemnae]|eukprot:CDW80481.1 UNKNOWN [Stylonychia lemnae]